MDPLLHSISRSGVSALLSISLVVASLLQLLLLLLLLSLLLLLLLLLSLLLSLLLLLLLVGPQCPFPVPSGALIDPGDWRSPLLSQLRAHGVYMCMCAYTYV